jgi:hypothetical protein
LPEPRYRPQRTPVVKLNGSMGREPVCAGID